MKLPLKRLTPSQILILAFAIAIFVGTILLMLPFSHANKNNHIDFITALYTATSAVCVTGLSIVDISREFSYTGQIIILLLIQLGGLGIITFTSLIMLIVGKKITYGERQILKEGLNRENVGGVIRFIRKAIFIILTIEMIGAAFLLIPFTIKYGFHLKTFFYAIFHAVSAFCNAGFSTFSNNLVDFQRDYIVNIVIATLIFLGGIGFAVIEELIELLRGNKIKTSLNSKVAVIMSVWLIVVGALLFLVLEYDNVKTIGLLDPFEKIMASIFQSITPRTAGFNTVPIEDLKPATILLMMVLMFIGAAPGSAGGGIKVTTFLVIIYTVFTIIRGKKDVEIDNRRISWEIINRSVVIFVISIMYILFSAFVIMIYENKDFIKIIFEVISAFGTVGLSMNFSNQLSNYSKIIIIFTMFFGRVGLFTVAIALGEKLKVDKHRLPKENISVG